MASNVQYFVERYFPAITEDVPLGDFVKEMVTPTLTNPQMPKILHYVSQFLLKTR